MMGADSTMNITREDALAEIQKHLNFATDDEIASILYNLIGYKLLYNFSIVYDYSGDWSIRYTPGLLRQYPDEEQTKE